jgi:hypothetical protein
MVVRTRLVAVVVVRRKGLLLMDDLGRRLVRWMLVAEARHS